ncbi:actin-related protein 2/3 complex subunit 3 [Tanacetum coccineum]|uniref:Actin-related protein 2/3 complex subunit 3 n=1 Tax=Tanacetum coccineum TaxID=301880 RepID=A0ABQ4Y3N7_9ASTR
MIVSKTGSTYYTTGTSKLHKTCTFHLIFSLCAATTDIIDEAITFFRANVFFKNFDIQSPADKLLIYLTFYINVALKRLEGCRTLAEGTKAVINLGLEDVPIPGEPTFPFPGLFPLPGSQQEGELLRNYLKQIREETSGRLLSVAYRPNGTPNKWWLAFAKRKFINTIALN